MINATEASSITKAALEMSDEELKQSLRPVFDLIRAAAASGYDYINLFASSKRLHLAERELLRKLGYRVYTYDNFPDQWSNISWQ